MSNGRCNRTDGAECSLGGLPSTNKQYWNHVWSAPISIDDKRWRPPKNVWVKEGNMKKDKHSYTVNVSLTMVFMGEKFISSNFIPFSDLPYDFTRKYSIVRAYYWILKFSFILSNRCFLGSGSQCLTRNLYSIGIIR